MRSKRGLLERMHALEGRANLGCVTFAGGQSTRSYLYVEDVAAAFDVILHKGVVGETYNIGTQKVRAHALIPVLHAGAAVPNSGRKERALHMHAMHACCMQRLSTAGVHDPCSPVGFKCAQERTVMDVAHDIAQHFGLPQERIVHVRDRAFNDQRCAPPYFCTSCAD
jgi:hypothetical protein